MNDLEFVGDYRVPHLSARQRALGHDGSSDGEFTFGDFLDIINPLQHIPIVSSIYRAITDDQISPHARILGDTLFGGPTGFLSSIANVLYEEVAGEDVGETVIALFTGEDEAPEPPQFAGDGGTVSAAGALPEAPPGPLEAAAGYTTSGPAAPAAEPVAERASAVLPEAAPGMLTGQDAFNALFMDLRGSRQGEAARPLIEPKAESMPLPGRAADALPRSYPLPPRGPHAPAPAATAAPENTAHPLLFAQEAAGGSLADRMMQALDKYQAMARQRGGQPRREDENREEDRMTWQSDPQSDLGAAR